ncbi:hypothetical protein [Vibrio fluvialis]|uniref:hypothetical protein n=1 Tax=Vibrio fluvialis TaxID=676 RepID=UPI0023A95615|nr:hypothetical protein [Vibrio fluvialis]MDE5179216.1 hypothetical protein [Vibrio fluvialis]
MTIDPTVLAAIIEGGCNILATSIPAIIALVVSFRFMGVKRANSTAYSALREIVYLRSVISEFERITNKSSLAARRASAAKGISSTKLFNASVLARKLATYERLTNQSLPLE